MPKRKYKFNPETLKYEKVGLKTRDRFIKYGAYFLSSLALALTLVVIFLKFYETPKMKALQRENQRILTQYELMSKDLDNIDQVLQEIQQRDDNIYRVIFETDPIPTTIRKAGFGGVNKYSKLEDLKNSELIIGTAKKLDVISKEAYIQSKSYDEVMHLAKNKEKMLACVPAVMPISNKDLTRTASGFSYRIHPIYKIRKFHYGMDFTSPTGTEVYATGDGKVIEVKGSKRSRVGFGMVIKIDHGYGYVTVYAHLSKFNVRRGDIVKRGDVIGYVGNTGGSTAPHLHYEVHKNNVAVNPQYYYYKDLSPEEYEKMIAISTNAGQSFD